MTDCAGRDMRATFLTVMPSPYIQDLFAALAMRINLRVLYLETQAPDTYWGDVTPPPYAEVLPGAWWGVSGARLHYNPTVKRRLHEIDSDVYVVAGYLGVTQQLAMRWLNWKRLPWAFWGEVPGMRNRGWVGSWLRSRAMTPLRRAAGVAAVGQAAAAAYGRLAGAAYVANLPYFCDLSPYVAARSVDSWTGERPLRVLYCGQMIARKGVDVLMRAIESLTRSRAEY